MYSYNSCGVENQYISPATSTSEYISAAGLSSLVRWFVYTDEMGDGVGDEYCR
jgi:hypothetical protein